MAQVNLFPEQKQTHRHGDRLVLAKGGGGCTGSLGLVDANYYI